MKDLILFGMQGSGKGTQGKIISKKYGYQIFETGQELRSVSQEETELGKRISKILDAGMLVDTKTIMELVKNFLEKNREEKIIFDGIPRSLEQKTEFDKLMQEFSRKPLGILIDLTEEEALIRLLSRFTCVGVDMSKNPLMTEEECIILGGKVKRRSDDNEEAIKKRLEIFRNDTLPVIDSYLEAGDIVKVNGQQNLNELTKDLEKIITKN
jgi:adenylate kinase